jgi:carbonic anhydrase
MANETTAALDTLGIDDKKSFLAQAQETATAAFNTTVEAVKEHPGIAAAAVAGTAAAVAGAAYGVSKLTASTPPAKARTSSKKK